MTDDNKKTSISNFEKALKYLTKDADRKSFAGKLFD